MSSLPLPVLFLDFDRTLFDTEKFYAWLGPDRYAGILALMSGEREEPDYAQFLYADAIPFLTAMHKKYRLVILSYAVNVLSQRRKIRGTGVTPFFDDILITGQQKGIAAKTYLSQFHLSGWRHVFVDDVQEHLVNMKKENPSIFTVYIDRTTAKVLPSRGMSLLFDEMVFSLTDLQDILLELKSGEGKL